MPMEVDTEELNIPPRQPTPPTGRGHRIKRPSRRILDRQPEGPKLSKAGTRRLAKLKKEEAEKAAKQAREAALELDPEPQPEPQVQSEPETDVAEQPDTRYRTSDNAFGLSREYQKEPMNIPDATTSPAAATTENQSSTSEISPEEIAEIIRPYPNLSSFKLAHLAACITRIKSSIANTLQMFRLDRTIVDEDIAGVNFDALKEKTANSCFPWEDGKRGWRKSTLSINIPSGEKDDDIRDSDQVPEDTSFEVDNFWYRPIMPLLRTILTTSPDSKSFHYEPYRQWWTRPGSSDPPSRVYDEIYTSDSWLEEHEKVQKLDLPEGEPDIYPRAIAGLMFWSDSTHLAEFGQAHLWPIYMAFGNQSKYERAKPGNRALLHLAYLPSVSNRLNYY